MGKFVVLSHAPERVHWSRSCRMGTDSAEFERATFETEDEVAEHIATLVERWGDLRSQDHWVFTRFEDLAFFAGNQISYGGYEPKTGIQHVVHVPTTWDIYECEDNENWGENQKIMQELNALESRLIASVNYKLLRKNEAAVAAHQKKLAAEAAEQKRKQDEEDRKKYEQLKKKFEPTSGGGNV